MAAYMRYSVLIILCLMSFVSAGPVTAACATDLDRSADSLTVADNGSAAAGDCDMGRNKAHKCNHDACCGYQLAAIAEIGDYSTPRPARLAAVASVTKHLASTGQETLLDPPRT